VLTCVTHLRAYNALNLALAGDPGDLVWLEVGSEGRWLLDAVLGGVRLVAPGSRRLFLGTVSGSGTLNASLPFGDLGPGIDEKTFHLQAHFRAAGGAAQYVGSGAMLVLLDSAY
jgi:hypothetical protein